MTLDSPSTAPTERSMPAVMMTNVMPTAMMPVSDTARTMLAMLSGARNRIAPRRRGENTMPPITTSTRPIRLWKRTITASGSRRRGRRGERRGLLCHQPSMLFAAAITVCSSSPAPANSATLRPCRNTTTRSHRPISSGISLEATRIPSPLAASSRSRA